MEDYLSIVRDCLCHIWQLPISLCNLGMPCMVIRGPLNMPSPNVTKTDTGHLKQQLSFLMSENFFRKRTGLSGWVVTTSVINSVTRQDILEHWSQIGNLPKNVKLKSQGNWTDCIPFWSHFLCIMLQQNLSIVRIHSSNIYMYVCVWACARVRACVCACVRARARERESPASKWNYTKWVSVHHAKTELLCLNVTTWGCEPCMGVKLHAF
jgi:hypothetical protein